MMNNLVLSILAVAQVGGIALPKKDLKSAVPPVVKAVGFETHGGHGTVGGQQADGWIELSGQAPCETLCGTYINGKPSGGMTVQMTSSDTAAVKVQSVRVPTGETRTTFAVLTSGVSAATPVTISAWREGSAVQKTILNVIPTSLNGLKIDPTSLIGGAAAHGALTFSGVPGAAGGVKATLSSSNPAAVQVPPTVSLDANKTVATFDLKTSAVASSTPVTITAAYGSGKPTAALTVTPAALAKFNGWNVELDGAAPSNGASVNLSSADPSHVSVAPTVNIPAGARIVTLSYTDHNDWSEHRVTISVTYNGVTKTADHYVLKNLKPDLAISDVTLQDRFGTTIVHPADAQPYKMCVSMELLGAQGNGHYLKPASTSLGVSYMNSPTGTGASEGHDFDVPVAFTGSYPAAWYGGGDIVVWNPPVCIDMPGLPQPGSYTDVTLKVDSKNQTDETNEGNNSKKLRITRQ
jgi:hypothetical protein